MSSGIRYRVPTTDDIAISIFTLAPPVRTEREAANGREERGSFPRLWSKGSRTLFEHCLLQDGDDLTSPMDWKDQLLLDGG